MNKRRIIMAKTARLIVVFVVIAVIMGLPATTMAGRPGVGRNHETLIVPFVYGDAGVQTVNSYSGLVQVAVRGTGQASATEWSDAFYIFTDAQGSPVEPYHPDGWFNFTLWINGGPADSFVDPIPPYNPAHVYVFYIVVPEGPLTFAVGDAYTIDNSGEYQVFVRDLDG
jgi:hypothetical protein